MPRFKVGGQASFITEVRAKDATEAQRKALGKAWREGAIYVDDCMVQRIVRKGGEDVVLEEGE